MKLVADLHIHSHFSRATSKNLTFEHLTRWAQLKGIQVVAAGDIAHPGWLQEMRAKLAPSEDGLYRLADAFAPAVQATVPPACRGPVRFLLGGEISNIYKRDERTRKVHNLVFAPDLDALARLQARLEKIGNIRADGRPILGLDSRDLLAIVLETGPACCLIPAHIWTPWFSLLGSKSGFDSVAACFGDLTPHIFALETGLSSDPPMNWRVSALDRYTLVSNSDAHSPEKLGREATLFDCELSYGALFAALRGEDPAGFGGTVEFFPEEGKYHYDGHRACGIVWDPETTRAHGGICPVCGKEVTIGVMHRVAALADRPLGGRPPRPQPFVSLVPLPELLGEVFGVGAGSRQVEAEYARLLARLGPELTILRDAPLPDIAAAGGSRLAEGIGRMRRGEVQAAAGYDGEYGTIRVFAGAAGAAPAGQLGLLPGDEAEASAPGEQPGLPADDETPPTHVQRDAEEASPPQIVHGLTDLAASAAATNPCIREESVSGERAAAVLAALATLNPQQAAAAACVDRHLVIVAGPGTGKTRTLTVRIAYLVAQMGVAPEAVLAITFTNKAAAEMAGRLAALLGLDIAVRLTIKTFHAFGLYVLRTWAAEAGLPPRFSLCSEDDRRALLRRAQPDLPQSALEATLAAISRAKNLLLAPGAAELAGDEQAAPGFAAAYAAYEAALGADRALDFDDLIVRTVRLLETQPAVLAALQARYRWISVDEYQDVNLAQYRLLRLLAAGGANLCAIGDPDQAIYGFRGADHRYFQAFQADYPGAAVLRLDQNYRSTQAILDAAGQVIAADSGGGPTADLPRSPSLGGRAAKGEPGLVAAGAEALADFAEGVRLDIHRAATDRAEAEYVVHQVEQMIGGTSYFSLDSGRVAGAAETTPRSFADFAILYRLGGQARLLAEAFERSGIPYQTTGQAPLATYPDVRQVLNYLWLWHDPGSRLHLEAVLTAGKPAFDAAAAARVARSVTAHIPRSPSLGGSPSPGGSPSLGGSAAEGANAGGLAAGLDRTADGGRFTAGQRRRLGALAAFWRTLADLPTDLPRPAGPSASGPRSEAEGAPSVAELIEHVGRFIDAGSAPIADAARRRERLLVAARPYGGRLAEFLETILLQGETDAYDPAADRVALLTLHAAKGLEFPVVFIVGCEEGLLPYRRPGAEADVAEERRLFYVGMTRARHKLVLVSAAARTLYGRRVANPPSRFVDDIENALKDVQAARRRAAARPESGQLRLF